MVYYHQYNLKMYSKNNSLRIFIATGSSLLLFIR